MTTEEKRQICSVIITRWNEYLKDHCSVDKQVTFSLRIIESKVFYKYRYFPVSSDFDTFLIKSRVRLNHRYFPSEAYVLYNLRFELFADLMNATSWEEVKLMLTLRGYLNS